MSEISVFYARTSAMDPAGPSAASISDLTWWMTWTFTAVFILVMALLFFGIRGREKEHTSWPQRRQNWFIFGGGILFPAVVLAGLLIYTLNLTAEIKLERKGIPIRITGHMWWWEVLYPDDGIITANEIYIPVGEPVQIELYSKDVIHSLWVPSLAGKMDLIPGVKNQFVFEASEPGTFRGQCAEYCGLEHARMSIFVVALPPEEFKKWREQKKNPKLPTQNPEFQAGLQVFHKVGCAECHSIKNTSAQGRIGPDLTHIGSRLSLGAGTVANNHGNLMGWISNPQALKPGNKMPRSYLTSEDLHRLTHYLMTTK